MHRLTSFLSVTLLCGMILVVTAEQAVANPGPFHWNRGYYRNYVYPAYYYSGSWYPGSEYFIYGPTRNPRFQVACAPATIEVRVPDPVAEVWFNGEKNTLTGMIRTFTTPPLQFGLSYHYQVKCQWHRNGQPVLDERNVTVLAGSTIVLDFAPRAPSAPFAFRRQ